MIILNERPHAATVQKMADFDDEDEDFVNDDFYAVLNVRKEVGCQIIYVTYYCLVEYRNLVFLEI